MSQQEKHKFTPPPQELGGESLVSYFAMQLFDQIIALRARDYGVLKFQETPIFQNAPHILEERDRINEKLRNLQLYFYKPDSSVFRDYKIMRAKKFPIEGQLISWQNEHIKITMSTEDVFEICKKEVATWWNLK